MSDRREYLITRVLTAGAALDDGEAPQPDLTDVERNEIAAMLRDGASLPESIQQALNSGDGVYRP